MFALRARQPGELSSSASEEGVARRGRRFASRFQHVAGAVARAGRRPREANAAGDGTGSGRGQAAQKKARRDAHGRLFSQHGKPCGADVDCGGSVNFHGPRERRLSLRGAFPGGRRRAIRAPWPDHAARCLARSEKGRCPESRISETGKRWTAGSPLPSGAIGHCPPAVVSGRALFSSRSEHRNVANTRSAEKQNRQAITRTEAHTGDYPARRTQDAGRSARSSRQGTARGRRRSWGPRR